jgi:hypothetical protein
LVFVAIESVSVLTSDEDIFASLSNKLIAKASAWKPR